MASFSLMMRSKFSPTLPFLGKTLTISKADGAGDGAGATCVNGERIGNAGGRGAAAGGNEAAGREALALGLLKKKASRGQAKDCRTKYYSLSIGRDHLTAYIVQTAGANH